MEGGKYPYLRMNNLTADGHLDLNDLKYIDIPDDIEAFTELLWNSLNEDNKVSLFVRYIDIATGTYTTKIVNKNH